MRPVLILPILLALPSLAFAQGALAPFGAPAPTMKTLNQIEARTPIGKVGGSTEQIGISESGSYVLLGNVFVSSGDAITISASNVTLDLNGFTLSSSESNPVSAGIMIRYTADSVIVRNGHVRSGSHVKSDAAGYQFVPGPGFHTGLLGNSSTNLSVENVDVDGVSSGIELAPLNATTVRHCKVADCGIGIRCCLATDCVVDNSLTTAIQSDTAIDCRARSYDSGGAILAKVAQNCVAYNKKGKGLECVSALGCTGESESGVGLSATTAEDCRGTSFSGTGLFADNATNCRGSSSSGTGLDTNSEANGYTGTATGCTGISLGGHGLIASVATNCTGRTTDKSKIGVWVSGTATGCRAANTGDTGAGAQTALSCTIAVACTASAGSISATSKQLGTP